MSLKQTFKTIEEIALATPLVNSFYFERWSDTVDSVPTYIKAKVVKSLSGGYEITFEIMDLVSDKDSEYDSVRSDTLMTFKDFFHSMGMEKLVNPREIECIPKDDNQLTGWLAEKVVVTELNKDCY